VHCIFNTVKTCGDPPTVSKALADIPGTITEGAVTTYSCATRYGLVGDKKLTCKNGKWAGVVPSCQGTVCVLYDMTICVAHSLWHVNPSTTHEKELPTLLHN